MCVLFGAVVGKLTVDACWWGSREVREQIYRLRPRLPSERLAARGPYRRPSPPKGKKNKGKDKGKDKDKFSGGKWVYDDKDKGKKYYKDKGPDEGKAWDKEKGGWDKDKYGGGKKDQSSSGVGGSSSSSAEKGSKKGSKKGGKHFEGEEWALFPWDGGWGDKGKEWDKDKGWYKGGKDGKDGKKVKVWGGKDPWFGKDGGVKEGGFKEGGFKEGKGFDFKEGKDGKMRKPWFKDGGVKDGGFKEGAVKFGPPPPPPPGKEGNKDPWADRKGFKAGLKEGEEGKMGMKQLGTRTSVKKIEGPLCGPHSHSRGIV